MSKTKKPDQVVFDEEEQKYTASLLPYATNVGAPAIITQDTNAWKSRNVNKANTQIKAKYLELKAEYDKVMQSLEYNNLVYNAKFNFEPIIGETYYLYKNKNDEPFLSIIAPNDCNFDYVGSFYLNSEQLWIKIEDRKGDESDD
ncbi:DUF2452 domain-containing protein [Sediminibacter sp. Hel_I_10]|uniref:DUF2452 domain-containing protein n=1 Tax=Sediminibacter sp. Hel_I_10 TaxID=1392490 RepID=UPI000478EF87|nr:DUF2452 domain-containing protein [Sediminibacter sp. Hel_I_10]